MKRATIHDYRKMTKKDISIHALVKRATKDSSDSSLPHAISIHALVKRATAEKSRKIGNKNDFNPRPREEGDLVTAERDVQVFISIHALVKRATYELENDFCNFIISIHALVKRATKDKGDKQMN